MLQRHVLNFKLEFFHLQVLIFGPRTSLCQADMLSVAVLRSPVSKETFFWGSGVAHTHTSCTALFAAFQSHSSFFVVVLLLLRISVSI